MQEQALGVNPFKLGLIGSTDTHNATPGGTEEQDFGANGHLGLRDHANPAFMLAARHAGRHRGDAGRPRRRVGGGELARRALRRHAPARGVRHERQPADPALLRRPRAGAPLRRSRLRRSRLSRRRADGRRHRPGARRAAARASACSRSRDPGTPTSPGTPLQRIQIVKGWVDAGGQSHEKVFDVAGNPTTAPRVDTADLHADRARAPTRSAPSGAIPSSTRASAPSTTRACSRTRPAAGARTSATRQGIDCSDPGLGARRATPSAATRPCRRRSRSAPGRRRSGTTPRASRASAARSASATTPRHDVLDLELDARRHAGRPRPRDAGAHRSRSATTTTSTARPIPAGTLQQTRPGRFVWNDATGSDRRHPQPRLQQRGARPRRRSGSAPCRLALAGADRVDHFVEVSLRGRHGRRSRRRRSGTSTARTLAAKN